MLVVVENNYSGESPVARSARFVLASHLSGVKYVIAYGTGLCAMDDAFAVPNVRSYLAKNIESWLGDQLHDRMQQLHNFLAFEPPTTVVYAHCEGGIDRTGELMGAYYLRWLNKSWAEMNQLNAEIANRPFGCDNYRATLWYSIYLVETLQFKLDYTQAFECADPGYMDGHYACGSPPPQ
jgi:hypothetical protein